MMNNYTVRDFIAMGFYEKADLRCWLKIWQAVKREQHKLHPKLDTNGEEFLNLCGKRAEIIFGYTQTVDSPLHRPQMMRAGGAIEKAYSSFMAEPLKTYNIFRDSFVMASQNANEAKYLKNLKKTSTDRNEIAELKQEIKGLKKQWHRNMTRMLTVLALNGVAAAFAKAFIQALRKLDTNADDDDAENDNYWKLFFEYWAENTSSNLNIIEQVPGGDLMMDVIDSIFEALTDPENASYTSILFKKNDILTDWLWNPVEELQSLQKAKAKEEVTMDDYFDFILSLATLGGFGFANAKRDTGATAHALATLLGIDTSVFAGTNEEESSGGKKSSKDSEGFFGKVAGTASGVKSGASSTLARIGNAAETVLGFGGKQFTSDDGLLTKFLERFGMKEGGKLDKWLDGHGLTMTDKEKKARKRQQEIDGYLAKGKGKSGETKEKAIYSAITKDWKKSFEDGESLKSCYKNVDHMLDMMDACKLSEDTKEKFIKNVTSNTKTMYKKEIGKETDESFKKMEEHIKWLTQNGWSAEDISSKIVMQSNTKREFQCALKMGDTDGAIKELTALYDAGLTDTDAWKAYKNYTRCTVDKTSKYWQETKATGTYTWPVRGTITSYYGNRSAPTAGASSNHQAIDIAVAEGTTVGAADGGTVVYAGLLGTKDSGYGYTVKVDHGNGVVTQYGHLSKIGVSVGQKVSKGQEIAKSGNTGTSTGPHLDFKMWINGSTVDPLKRLRS